MTYPYGALAMLCLAIRNACRTYPCLPHQCTIELSRFLSPFVFHIFYFFSLFFIAPPLSLDSVWPLPLSFMFHCTLLDL